MVSHVSLKARRGRVAYRRKLEHREKRLDVHEQIEDWFLGPRPEGEQHWDVHPVHFQDHWGNPTDADIVEDPVAKAMDRLKEPWFRLQARVERGLSNPRAWPRPAIEPEDAGDGPSANAAVEALETFAAEWARSLCADPVPLLEELTDDPEALDALRNVGSRVLRGRSYADLAEDPFPPMSWHRTLAVAALAHPMWLRSPATWQGATPQSLLQHLMCDFPVPPVLTEWLLNGDMGFGFWRDDDERLVTRARLRRLVPLVWWVARASGCSPLRLFRKLELPCRELSAAEIVALEDVPSDSGASPSLEGLMALGEVLRLGGRLKDWHRMAGPLHGPQQYDLEWQRREVWRRLESHFRHFPLTGRVDEIPGYEGRQLTPQAWRATVRWLVHQGAELGDDEVPCVLNWALVAHWEAPRGGHPPFSWKGRTARSVRAAALAFMARWRDAIEGRAVVWSSQGWDLEWVSPVSGQPWHMRELTSSEQLADEGATQRHCVASYAQRCVLRQAAIFQLTRDGIRCVTLEVLPPSRTIVQARGRFNAQPDAEAQVEIRRWAQQLDINVEQL